MQDYKVSSDANNGGLSLAFEITLSGETPTSFTCGNLDSSSAEDDS
jgi:hypothetical protein